MAPNHLRGVAITGRMPQEYDSILTPECISFVAHLARMYTPRVNELLNRWGCCSHVSPNLIQREVLPARASFLLCMLHWLPLSPRRLVCKC